MADAAYELKSTLVQRVAGVPARSVEAALAVIALVMIAGSLPLVLIGYGSNQDAARGAQAAETFFRTGAYHSSRVPGNPLYEYALTLIVPWAGFVGANLLSVLCYAGSVHAFALLVRGFRHRTLLTLTFALTPVLLLNAVTAKDFVPGLALMLYAYICTTRRRSALASVLMGLAIGCRITNVLLVICLGVYSVLRGERPPRVALRAGASVLIGLAFYAPIFAEHRFGMFVLNPNKESHLTALLRTADTMLTLFGTLATVGLAAVTLRHRATVSALFRRIGRSSEPELTANALAVLLFTLLFALNSNQVGYLLIIVPFVYLLIARWVTGAELALLALLVASYALVDIDLKGGSSGARTVALHLNNGLIVQEFNGRQAMHLLRSGIGRCVPGGKAVVLTGLSAGLTFDNDALLPASLREIDPALDTKGALEAGNVHRLRSRDVFLVYALSAANIRVLQERGYALYYFPQFVPAVEESQFGVDLYHSPYKALETSGAGACYA